MKKSDTVKAMKHPLSLAAILGATVLCVACTTQEGVGDVASVDRECRTIPTPGSKMRQSVCRSKQAWAEIDAREAAQRNSDAQKDEFFRRALEQATQSPPAAFDDPALAPP